jgi:hypothetical protein
MLHTINAVECVVLCLSLSVKPCADVMSVLWNWILFYTST